RVRLRQKSLSLKSEVDPLQASASRFASNDYPVKAQLRRSCMPPHPGAPRSCHFDRRDGAFCLGRGAGLLRPMSARSSDLGSQPRLSLAFLSCRHGAEICFSIAPFLCDEIPLQLPLPAASLGTRGWRLVGHRLVGHPLLARIGLIRRLWRIWCRHWSLARRSSGLLARRLHGLWRGLRRLRRRRKGRVRTHGTPATCVATARVNIVTFAEGQ